MKYCRCCLQPDTRPNTQFREDGLCPACHYFDQLKDVDWQERYEILQDLIDKFPRRKGQFHDCIIGGGKDSTRQALWVRDKLGLNPLLVCLTYPPEQVSERGRQSLQSDRARIRRTHLGSSTRNMEKVDGSIIQPLHQLVSLDRVGII